MTKAGQAERLLTTENAENAEERGVRRRSAGADLVKEMALQVLLKLL